MCLPSSTLHAVSLNDIKIYDATPEADQVVARGVNLATDQCASKQVTVVGHAAIRFCSLPSAN